MKFKQIKKTQSSIKFDLTFSIKKINFLDNTAECKTHSCKLQTKFDRKDSTFDFLLNVSQNWETYAASKFYIRNHLKAERHKEHVIFSMTITVRVNCWYTLWHVPSAITNALENDKYNLALDWIIIVRRKMDKTHHKQTTNINKALETLVKETWRFLVTKTTNFTSIWLEYRA